MAEYHIRIKWDECAWVAQFKPGGPDVASQGATPLEALQRLAMTFQADLEAAGSIENIPTW